MLVFFFQAEDGIRDGRVTGVQTCALPIWKVTPICRICWLIAEHAARKTIIIGGRPSMEGWTAATYSARVHATTPTAKSTASELILSCEVASRTIASKDATSI